MEIKGCIAVVTGAGSPKGIGLATAKRLAELGALNVVLVDVSPQVDSIAQTFNAEFGREVFLAYRGPVTNEAFRTFVYDEVERLTGGLVTLCLPAAGITRNGLAVSYDKGTQKATMQLESDLRAEFEVNFLAARNWCLEMVVRLVEYYEGGPWDKQGGLWGKVILFGSVCSEGNYGQHGYSSLKGALVVLRTVLNKEWRKKKWGIRCGIVHPGYVRTGMMDDVPDHQLLRVVEGSDGHDLISPEAIAKSICHYIEDDLHDGEKWLGNGFRVAA